MRVLALVILALLCSGCRGEGGQERRARVAVVGVAHPAEATPSQSHEYTGTVESLNQVAVVPQVAGQLESVEVSVGESVERGQLLAVVDDSQLEAQVNQARATAAAGQASVQTALANLAAQRDQTRTQQQAVAQAEAQLIEVAAAVEKAEVQQKLALTNLKRIEEVAAKDLIAIQVVDEARAQAESALADVKAARAQQTAAQGQLKQAHSRVKTASQQEKAAEAQVSTARAQVDSLLSALQAVEVRRDYTRVISPIDGVVVARRLDPGAYVSPGSSSAVLEIAGLEQLRVAFALSEADLSLVKAGQEVTISFDALPNLSQAGIVGGLAGGLDPSTRTMRVEVRLTHVDPRLRPGMLARLKVKGQTRQGLTIPIQAVQKEGGKFSVFVVQADQNVARRTIEVDGMEGDVALVKSGLSKDDTVVVRGTDQVQEGKPVEAVEVDW